MERRIRRWLDVWDGQPTWLRKVEGAAIALTILVVLNLVRLVVGRDSAVPDIMFWLAIVTALVGSTWLGNVRLGGRGQARLFRESMKQGRVADGADRPSWRTEIARRASYRQRARRASRRLLVMLAVLFVVAIVLGVLLDEWQSALVAILPLLVMALVIAYLLLVLAPRTRRRLDVLERELAADE